MAERAAKKESSSFVEVVIAVVQAVALALVIRTVLLQPFSIPSGSMIPTLLVGDYVLVTKWSYGYSKYSLPFSPDLFDGRILGSEPERGDVIVFRKPSDTDVDFIKRLIGLPGDNGKPLAQAFALVSVFIPGDLLKAAICGMLVQAIARVRPQSLAWHRPA